MIYAREQNDDLELPGAWTELRAKVLRNVKEARVWSSDVMHKRWTCFLHLRSVRRYARWCLKLALEREGPTFHILTSTLCRF